MPVPRSIRLGVVVLGLLLLLIGSSAPAPAQTKKAPPPKPVPKAAPKAAPKSEPAPQPPAPPPPEDLVVKMRYVSGDTTTASTVSMKGRRQRIDYGADMAVLQQCDVDRIVQVNDQTRKFLVVETGRDHGSGAEPPAKGAKKGGTVTYTTTVTDTGERKPLFGLTARHLKTVLTKTPAPDACDKRKERVETDGWFIDPQATGCPVAPRATIATSAGDCRDAIEYVDPAGPAVGYPVAYTVTSTDEVGRTSTMSMEVTEFAKSTLPDALFTAPEGYTAAANLAQLGAPADGTKRAGVLRTCAASVAGTGAVSLDALTDALVISLGDAGLDAVRLSARTPVDERAEVQARECDYVLTTEIADVRKPGKGMLGRVAGTTEGFGARVDFRLTAPGSKVAQLASSERSGGSTLKTAIGAAKTVSRYVTPLGLLGPNFGSMSAFAAIGGGASAPAMGQSPDPVINTVFFLVDKATGNKPEPELVSEEAAVAAAMEKEVIAVAAFISKKPK